MAMMRLDRFFSSQELFTRREVRPLVRTGAVRVNGAPAVSAEQRVDPERDVIELYGSRVEYKPFLYLMLNKPEGYVSSTDDSRNPTVLELVPASLMREGLFPAGRLDRDTTGFVLLTNDGGFAHRILAPKNHVEKEYEALLDAPLTQEGIRRLAEGVTLADGTVCQGAEVSLLRDGMEPLARVVLCEGKYHQVKRMFGVLGIGVNGLKRVRIGGLRLDPDLPDGSCREIMHKELENILVK